MQSKVAEIFKSQFNSEGVQYAAAGRINLIGEHTDYNEGFVMPGAIDKVMVAEIKPNNSSIVRAYAIDLEEAGEFDLTKEELPAQSWLRYIYGVCREIIKRGGKIEGFDTAFSGNVPLGAGLSSSAALESAFGFAMNDLFNDNKFDKMELARIGQATEHNYCGVKCGIMDQFASIFGRKGHLIRLDCRSMEYEYFPFESEEYSLLLVNSNVKHELADSPYNRRRESCERVAAVLGRPSLREVTFEELNAVKDQISEEDYMRATFVIGEEQRVLSVSEALGRGDLEQVGKEMYGTHYGLSKQYEVSCEEIDYLVEVARECGVTGSRVMGGGFGGCTINLIKKELHDSFVTKVLADYKAKFGVDATIIDVVISDGARRL